MRKMEYHSLHMQLGEQALNQGKFKLAIKHYAHANALPANQLEVVQTLQMLGIAFRLAGSLDESEIVLLRALDLIDELDEPNPELQARIKRDLAMTLMERLRPGDTKRFNRIFDLLHESTKPFTKEDQEYWASLGFIGRAELLRGDRYKARMLMSITNHFLTDPTYKLNNLMWLMRVSMSERARWRRTALELIRQTGQTRRYIELAIIMLGGNRLHSVVRRFRR